MARKRRTCCGTPLSISVSDYSFHQNPDTCCLVGKLMRQRGITQGQRFLSTSLSINALQNSNFGRGEGRVDSCKISETNSDSCEAVETPRRRSFHRKNCPILVFSIKLQPTSRSWFACHSTLETLAGSPSWIWLVPWQS